METEKIDVPKFDGFECIGLVIPAKHLPCKYLYGDGETLIDADVGLDTHYRICYRKIKPKRITLEETNETREAKAGEFHMNDEGCLEQARWDSVLKYRIWRVVEEQS